MVLGGTADLVHVRGRLRDGLRGQPAVGRRELGGREAELAVGVHLAGRPAPPCRRLQLVQSL